MSSSLIARVFMSIGTVLLAALPTLLPMDDGSEWGVRFPPADGAVRDRLEFELRPGEFATDAIELINLSDAELIVAVTSADVEYDADGLAFAEKDEPVAAGLWLTSEASEYHLPPRTEQPLDFMISVPDDAQPGTYATALTLVQQVGVSSEGVIPVQRTIVVLAHIEVSGENELAETAAPLASWFTMFVITAGVVLLTFAAIVVLILRGMRARRREHG